MADIHAADHTVSRLTITAASRQFLFTPMLTYIQGLKTLKKNIGY